MLAQKSFAFLYFDCSGVTVFFGGPPNAFLGAAGALGLDGANWMPAGFDAGAGVGFAAGLAPPPKENGDDFAGAGAGVGFAAGLLPPNENAGFLAGAGAGVGFAAGLPPPKENGDAGLGAGAGVGFAAGFEPPKEKGDAFAGAGGAFAAGAPPQ